MQESYERFYSDVLYVERLDEGHVKMAVQSGDYTAHGVFPLSIANKLFAGLKEALEKEPPDNVIAIAGK